MFRLKDMPASPGKKPDSVTVGIVLSTWVQLDLGRGLLFELYPQNYIIDFSYLVK